MIRSMVNINWAAVMQAAQQGRLSEFFKRTLERKTRDEKKQFAYQVGGMAQFVESVFRAFAEDHAHLMGVNEALAMFDSIPDLAAKCETAKELHGEIKELHSQVWLAFRAGEAVDDPNDNKIAKRFYGITYQLHMECLKDYLKEETK